MFLVFSFITFILIKNCFFKKKFSFFFHELNKYITLKPSDISEQGVGGVHRRWDLLEVERC